LILESEGHHLLGSPRLANRSIISRSAVTYWGFDAIYITDEIRKSLCSSQLIEFSSSVVK
jgi:hypothetical protein